MPKSDNKKPSDMLSPNMRKVYQEHSSVTRLTVLYGNLEYNVHLQGPDGLAFKRFDAAADPAVGIDPVDADKIVGIARNYGHVFDATVRALTLN